MMHNLYGNIDATGNLHGAGVVVLRLRRRLPEAQDAGEYVQQLLRRDELGEVPDGADDLDGRGGALHPEVHVLRHAGRRREVGLHLDDGARRLHAVEDLPLVAEEDHLGQLERDGRVHGEEALEEVLHGGRVAGGVGEEAPDPAVEVRLHGCQHAVDRRLLKASYIPFLLQVYVPDRSIHHPFSSAIRSLVQF
ncbi:Os05g0590201 [Oryza sativa Japonica Group]|uniref:Os05g0590201 protein n=1 Tax=Oryza sativa subsp. japonica TaxID=39947 RepID=A0A0P0WR74_ORYSJ|nr:hypothetical protein EE612_031460 [Oryza sativa]BAS95616.1 Os05g0590201 [Oryza sativa Japonica Group]